MLHITNVRRSEPMITPIQHRILVKTKGQYANLETTEERFGTSKTRGEVLAIADDITQKQLADIGAADLKVGCMIYFGKYEDTAPYGADSDQILIKLEDVSGVSKMGEE
jgi:co-chaperonin GroES (HSP10)